MNFVIFQPALLTNQIKQLSPFSINQYPQTISKYTSLKYATAMSLYASTIDLLDLTQEYCCFHPVDLYPLLFSPGSIFPSPIYLMSICLFLSFTALVIGSARSRGIKEPQRQCWACSCLIPLKNILFHRKLSEERWDEYVFSQFCWRFCTEYRQLYLKYYQSQFHRPHPIRPIYDSYLYPYKLFF